MLPYILGAVVAGLLIKVVASSTSDKRKKVFISFAMEDEKYRDFLKGQAKNDKSPFDFIDMSVKEPYASQWKKKCRTKIKRCELLIVLLSKHTLTSQGAKWEIKCAKEEDIPVVGMYIKQNENCGIPPELKGKKVITWNWDNLKKIIED